MKHFIYLSILFAATLSCSNPDYREPDVHLPIIDKGRLSFQNAESYNLFIKATIEDDIEQIVHDLPGGFRSLHDYNVSKANQTSARSVAVDEVQDEVVWDPYFENLLNSDRELKISNEIYRITEVGVFFYTGDEHKGKMDSVQMSWVKKFSGNKSGRIQEIPCLGQPYAIDDVIYYLPGNDCSGFGGYYGGGGSSSPPLPLGPCGLSSNHQTFEGSASNIFGVNHTCELDLTGTTDRRIKGKFWAQNYVIFSSAGANTRSQNRLAWIWWAENADRIYLKYEGEIEQKDAFGNYWSYTIDPVVEDRANDNELSKTFEWTTAIVGIGCDPVTGSCKPKFKAASPFKIKRMETCHYVMDEGRHGEVNLLYR